MMRVVMLVVIMAATLTVMGQDNRTAAPAVELRIAIPVREYQDWVRVERDPITGEQQISGFSIEVFKNVVNKGLPSPIPYKLIPFVKADGVTMNGTFDDMLQAVFNQDYDGAVGEISVLYYRTEWVDFTLPYLDTQISMLIRQKSQPLTKIEGISLASATKYFVIATLAFSFFVALLFWYLEYKTDKKASFSKISTTSHSEQQARSNHDDIQRDIMGSITQTRLMMILFFMVLLLLMTCFTSTQTTMFTSKDGGRFENLNQLIRKGSNVGYRKGSFVNNLLIQKGFSESKLIRLDSEKQMAEMLDKGSENGGVDAVVADSVNLKLLLSKHCNYSFTIVPTVNLHTAGFGFAFRKGLELTSEFSQGILRVIDNGDLGRIQERTIGTFQECDDDELNKLGSNQPLGNANLWILIVGAIAIFILMAIILLVYCGFRCSTSKKRKVVAYPCYLVPCC